MPSTAMADGGGPVVPTTVDAKEDGEKPTLCDMARSTSNRGGGGGGGGGWRRRTLETPFHLFTITLCFFFVAIIELLQRLSKRNGALLFSDPETGKLPSYALFCFEYLPVIIAVVHNVLWMAVDHDVKRIEPYFQLSKPDGAHAGDSLLLSYSYQFSPFVPVSAFRKRHWTVFCSSMVALLAAYAVTPLMSAILTKETIERSIDFDVTSYTILPRDLQADGLSALFSHRAYGYKLLGDPIPAFSTGEFGVLPFAPAADVTVSIAHGGYCSEGMLKPWKSQLPPGRWVANTTLYEADLECVEAVEKRAGGIGSRLTLSNGRDCEFTFLDYNELNQDDILDIRNERFFTDFPYRAMLMNYDTLNQAIREESLGPTPFTLASKQANCSNPDQIFALWNRSDGMTDEGQGCHPEATEPCTPVRPDRGTTPENFAAVFCEPTYYEQAIQVTVDTVTGRVNETLRLGSRRPLNAAINSTLFGSFATYGTHAASTPALNVSRDYAPDDRNVFAAPDVRDRMARFPRFQMASTFDSTKYGHHSGIESSINTGFLYPRSMMGIAVIDQQDLNGLLDSEVLARKLRDTYKLYFSFAVTSELSVPSGATLTAQWKFNTQAYTTDPLWAGLLQAAFCAMAALDITLTCLLRNRRLNLNGDPGSLAALLASVSSSPTLLSDFHGSEFLPFERTAAKLRSAVNRYYLLALDGGGHRIDKKTLVDIETKPQPAIPPMHEETIPIRSARPWELSPLTGVGILISLLSLIGLFIALYQSGQKYNGVYTSDWVPLIHMQVWEC